MINSSMHYELKGEWNGFYLGNLQDAFNGLFNTDDKKHIHSVRSMKHHAYSKTSCALKLA